MSFYLQIIAVTVTNNLIEILYRYNISKINILTITAKIFTYGIYKVGKGEDWDNWQHYHILYLSFILNRQLYFKYKDYDASSISPASRSLIHTTYRDFTPDTRKVDSCPSTAKQIVQSLLLYFLMRINENKKQASFSNIKVQIYQYI